MTDRTFSILKLVVEHFIKTAEPVGSKTLLEVYNLKLSSATIRNEMQELENEGYLEKTHTSSGRVPSTKGYEYYVEHLRDRDKIAGHYQYQLANVLSERAKTIEDVLSESCEVLSDMTNLVSMVLGGNGEETLSNLILNPLSNNSATVVFITNTGHVESKTFFFDDKLSLNDLKNCVQVLSSRLVGTRISELAKKTELLKPILFDQLLDGDVLYQTLLRSFIKLSGNRMVVYGKEKLLDQPEFSSDPESIKKLMDMLDSPEYFREISNDTYESKGISIKIGNENSNLKDISVISAKVDLPGAEDKIISVVGPVRMDYEGAVNAIESILDELHRKYSDPNKEE